MPRVVLQQQPLDLMLDVMAQVDIAFRGRADHTSGCPEPQLEVKGSRTVPFALIPTDVINTGKSPVQGQIRHADDHSGGA
jgi:hypothetical protein